MNILRKYPKTMHFPWSPGLQNDDRVITDLTTLETCNDVIITEKRDGENTSMYNNRIHARSLDSRDHPSRSWVKQMHASIKHEIPEGMRICGENLYALHSIAYDNLDTYFEVFNIWMGDTCLSWDETVEWCNLLGLQTVPVIYRGKYDESFIKTIHKSRDENRFEGYVVRVSRSFELSEFPTCIAKYVRKNHVQTDELWMLNPVVPNKLKETK
jgi:hypothetical protein